MSEPEHRPTAPPASTSTALPVAARWLLIALAVLSLVLGIVGIFVPVLPTVPFVLLAAWAAARSSPRLLAWLERHPAFGPMLTEWRRGGVVRRRAKWAATVGMGISATMMLVVVPTKWIALAVIACMACVLIWLWRRPEHLPEEELPPQ
ncbi:MAG TPA: YbaN family protein [Polaromonas sp.]|uniref:YbaN family protein n=1 Tax=Polaromonas sp. TaxID=1869339 RepID=UPI002D40E1A2|nr:YbaN family protein [Polaromonas sp.]HYW58721.1 YbaN family protein [Polaromonas sp.]